MGLSNVALTGRLSRRFCAIAVYLILFGRSVPCSVSRPVFASCFRPRNYLHAHSLQTSLTYLDNQFLFSFCNTVYLLYPLISHDPWLVIEESILGYHAMLPVLR